MSGLRENFSARIFLVSEIICLEKNLSGLIESLPARFCLVSDNLSTEESIWSQREIVCKNFSGLIESLSARICVVSDNVCRRICVVSKRFSLQEPFWSQRESVCKYLSGLRQCLQKNQSVLRENLSGLRECLQESVWSQTNCLQKNLNSWHYIMIRMQAFFFQKQVCISFRTCHFFLSLDSMLMNMCNISGHSSLNWGHF